MTSSQFLVLLLVIAAVTSAAAAGNDTLVRCLATATKDPNIGAIIYTPTAPSFSKILSSYIRNRRFNTPSAPKPTTIITPKTSAHVSAAVVCAKSLNLQLRIRSGGHDYDGLSYISNTPFLILDMFNFRAITIDMKSETAWVGAGATLGELYYHISVNSKVHAFPAGVCPTVAVGGHISGGGYGNLLRKFGLTVDHVVDAWIVNAKGEILNRKSMGEDLFWAIRGGGGASYGVVLGYKINLVRVPEKVSVFKVERWVEEDDATSIFTKWHQIAYDIDNDLFIRVLVQPVTPKKHSQTSITAATTKKNKTIRLTFISLFLGDSERLVSLTDKKFPELKLKKEDCLETSWIGSVLFWNKMNSTKELLDRDLANLDVKFLKRKSDYVQTPISKEGLNRMFSKMIELGKTGLVFNQYGGRMAEIPANATPFPHRAGNIFKIQYSVNWSDEGAEAEEEFLKQIRELYAFNAEFMSKNPRGAFVNYRDVDIGVNGHGSGKESYEEGEVYGRKYFLGNFDRLVKVKTAVDPDNFFRYEQSIPRLSA